jgi:hypothetical protein
MCTSQAFLESDHHRDRLSRFYTHGRKETIMIARNLIEAREIG